MELLRKNRKKAFVGSFMQQCFFETFDVYIKLREMPKERKKEKENFFKNLKI